MSEHAWTWLLLGMEVIGVTGMYFVGQRKWWGWFIVLIHSFPWAIYSVLYDKPGFIAMTMLWWTMNFRNMRKWRREQLG